MKRPVRTYRVTDQFGTEHQVDAHFMFNNMGELMFRLTEDDRNVVVAIFPQGTWSSCVRVAAVLGAQCERCGSALDGNAPCAACATAGGGI